MEETVQDEIFQTGPGKNIGAGTEAAAEEAADTFAKNGKAIVKSGMSLVLDRLRFARRYEDRVRAAIRLIDEAPELRTAQKKELIDALQHAAVMDTGKVLSLVTDVLERLEEMRAESGGEAEGDEVIVKLDKQVKKWAQ